MFNWKGFWNYYSAVTKNRNSDKVSTMIQGFDLAWSQYYQKYNPHNTNYLFVENVLYSKYITEYCKMAKGTDAVIMFEFCFSRWCDKAFKAILQRYKVV